MICFGHRGACGYESENTLASISKAIELGVDFVEIDVYFVDDHLVVHHDDTLDRTTNGTGLITDKSFEYLRSLDAGEGERIPTLDEVFDLVDKRVGINIELKGANTANAVCSLMQKYISLGWCYDDILVSSFDHKQLELIKSLDSKIKIGILVEQVYRQNLAKKAYSINMNKDSVNKQFVDEVHTQGLKVFVYTVNEIDDIVKMKNIGVDGVFSDYPDRVIKVNNE